MLSTKQIVVFSGCYIKYCQGCAPAEPSGSLRLTLALGQLENLTFFVQILCWTPWILQAQSTGLPSVFLRVQPWFSMENLYKVFNCTWSCYPCKRELSSNCLFNFKMSFSSFLILLALRYSKGFLYLTVFTGSST